MADTIRESIEETAKAGVSAVSVDGTRVEALDVEKQILADKYISGVSAAQQDGLGLVFRKMEPGGCG